MLALGQPVVSPQRMAGPLRSRRKKSINTSERITRHPFFQSMNSAHLAILTDQAREKRFETGEVLLREAEPAKEFYLIENGGMALEAHQPAGGTVLVQNLGPGEVLNFGYELMKRVAKVVIHRLQATRKQLLGCRVDSALPE